MKLRLLYGALILVLVSVYWFEPLSAQTLNQSDLDKLKENPELYHQYLQRGKKNKPNSYSSAEIYTELKDRQTKKRTDELKARYGLDSLQLRGEFGDIDSSLLAENSFLSDTNQSDNVTLKPFGLEIFANETEPDAPIEIPNAADYVLGPGDNLLVYLWGRVERELNLTIDRQGKIHAPPIGEVVAWGQTLERFEQRLRSRFASVYSDFQMNVTLGKIRSIRVYVIGEVQRPGAYTLSSLTTTFNALYQAGGPSERGSMRAIKHLRAGKLIGEIDLYDLLVDGVNTTETRLKSGDAIFVPVVGAQVVVDGEVRRPAIYEALENETAAELLRFAGGASATGFSERIALTRIARNSEPQLIDLNLDNESAGYNGELVVVDGDGLVVPSVYDVQRNFVSVAGMVKQPGRFERAEAMTLADVITIAQLRPDDVYRKRANLFRIHRDNRREVIEVSLERLEAGDPQLAGLKLQDRDSLHIYAMDEIEREKYVRIEGEVKNPGFYQLYDEMTAADLIFLAGSLKRAAFLSHAEIARTDSLGRVNLTQIDLSSNEAERITLHEDDRLYIRQIPEWDLHRRVSVVGEVRFPGEYALVSRNETLWQLIQRSGGFTDVAFPQGLILERGSISSSIFRRNLERVVASSIELEEDSLGNIREVEQIDFDAQSLNRIILDMQKLVSSSGTEGDITLQAGDKIFVPQTPPGISVLGAVGASGTIKFESERKAKYYLDRAGGFTRQSDEGAVKLVKADGRVFSGSDAKKRIVQLGDAIIVPTEVRREKNFMGSLSSLVQVVSGLATSVFIITKL